MGRQFKVKVVSGYFYEGIDVRTEIICSIFYSYDMHLSILSNIGSGDLEWEVIGEKYRINDDFRLTSSVMKVQ